MPGCGRARRPMRRRPPRALTPPSAVVALHRRVADLGDRAVLRIGPAGGRRRGLQGLPVGADDAGQRGRCGTRRRRAGGGSREREEERGDRRIARTYPGGMGTASRSTVSRVNEWWRDFFDDRYRDLGASRRPRCGPIPTSTASCGCSRATARRARPHPRPRLRRRPHRRRPRARGHGVTGLDYSASQLDAARERAARPTSRSSSSRPTCAAAARSHGPSTSRSSWYTSFGYFEETGDDLRR